MRLLDVLTLCYLIFSSEAARQLARSPFARLFEVCGKHSLEIFALGCLLALIGRLVSRTYGREWALMLAVNVVGLAVMCAAGLWMERERARQFCQTVAALGE